MKKKKKRKKKMKFKLTFTSALTSSTTARHFPREIFFLRGESCSGDVAF